MSNSMNRILIIANKWWEVKPLINVLLHQKARPKGFPEVDFVYNPEKKHFPTNIPRARLRFKENIVDIWCISDIMQVPPAHKSSTQEKIRTLPHIFGAGEIPSFTIAFGTAAYPDEISYNGCVTVGSKIFIYNPYPRPNGIINEESNWSNEASTLRIIESPDMINLKKFRLLENFLEVASQNSIKNPFLNPPLNPSQDLRILADLDYLSVGIVNITDYSIYDWADHEAIEAAMNIGTDVQISSLETTHGIIRLQCDSPFLWISGIADRVGYFSTEVAPRSYAQNLIAAHNAAIVITWLIPEINKYSQE